MISLELQVFNGCVSDLGDGPSYYALRCDCGREQKHLSVDEAMNALAVHIHSCRRALAPRGDKPNKDGDDDNAQGGQAIMTLEQIGLLAVLWHEADEDFDRRITPSPRLPHKRALNLLDRSYNALRGAIRDYKLLQEAKGKGANDGTV